jgi:hypothetical protein
MIIKAKIKNHSKNCFTEKCMFLTDNLSANAVIINS